MWRKSGGENIQLGRSYSLRNYKDMNSRWRTLWRTIKGEKKKVFHSPITTYDPDEYSQNFDEGKASAEPDNLYRSFSVRYAKPSRFLQQKMLD